jgi:hypothetical protein
LEYMIGGNVMKNNDQLIGYRGPIFKGFGITGPTGPTGPAASSSSTSSSSSSSSSWSLGETGPTGPAASSSSTSSSSSSWSLGETGPTGPVASSSSHSSSSSSNQGRLNLITFLALDYSNTFKRAEATTVGNYTAMVSSPAPPNSEETYCISMGQHKTGAFYNGRSAEYDLSDGDYCLMTCYWRVENTPVPQGPDWSFCSTLNATTQTTACGMKYTKVDASNHKLEIMDSTGAACGSVSNPFTADTWHLIEVMWQNKSNTTKHLIVRVDGNETSLGIGHNFIGGSYTPKLYLRGQGGLLLGNPTDSWINSAILFNGAASSNDFLGDYVILTEQSDKASATPDFDKTGSSGGDDLVVGQWDDTGDGSSSPIAKYTDSEFGDGAVLLDGPASYQETYPYMNIRGGKWLWWFTGSATSSILGIIYGVANDGDSAVVTSTGITGTRAFFYEKTQDVASPDSRLPQEGQKFVQGFYHNGGEFSGDVYCREAWSFLIIEKPS